MSLTDIVYGGRTIPRRPYQHDDEVLSDTFDAILPELAAECDWDAEKDTGIIEEARAEFIDAASLTDDGYEIMRNLEKSHSWAGNTRLVEIFGNAPFEKCVSKHVQLWIDHFHIEPLFQPGDTVTFRHGHEMLSGVVDVGGSYSEPGRYLIHVEGMDGNPIVRWEDCEKLQQGMANS